MKLGQFNLPEFDRPWLGGAWAIWMILVLSWLNFETGAIFGFATLNLVPVAWAGLTLPMGWSMSVGGLASLAWLFAALNTQLPRRIGQEDWLTIPLIYPSLAFLLACLSSIRC